MPEPSYDLAKIPTHEQNLAMLIFRVAQGDESAISALYDGTSRLVYGLALRILADMAEAEEVTIEVYMQIWRKAVDYDPERGIPSAWLLMLTRSRAIDRLRSGTQQHRLEKLLEVDVLAPTADPEETALVVERRRLVQDALAKLAPQQREAIELAYFSGLSQSKIAVRLGQPLGTVKA